MFNLDSPFFVYFGALKLSQEDQWKQWPCQPARFHFFLGGNCVELRIHHRARVGLFKINLTVEFNWSVASSYIPQHTHTYNQIANLICADL